MPAGLIRVPLSLVQETMWALERTAPTPGFYNETLRVRFTPPFEPDLVAAGLASVVERHESLRTTFRSSAGRLYQSIAPSAEVEIELDLTDLRSLPAESRLNELHRMEAREQEGVFDLAEGPLLRARLFLLDDGASELCLVLDHLVSDATSEAILGRELQDACAALSAGEKPDLPPVAMDYPDFAVWQRAWMNDARLREHYDYWRMKLQGVSSRHKVAYGSEMRDPAVGHRPDVDPTPVVYAFTLPADVYDRLRRVPGFVLCSAAVASLVARATGEPDVVFVTSVGGRDRTELERMVGLFGGLSVLRVDLSGDPPFEVVVRRARASVLGLLEHQHLPFIPVAETLRKEGTDVALLSVPVAVHFFRAAWPGWVPGASVVARPPEDEGVLVPDLPDASKPLEFRFYDDGTALWGETLYHPDYYDTATVAQIVADLKGLLAAVARNSLLRLSQLPLSLP